MKDVWPRAWKALGKYKYAVIVVLAGVLLLLLPAGTKEQEEPAPAGPAAEFDLDALERRMEEALSQIKGAGEVTVVLTLKNSGGRTLASDWEEDGESRRETVVTVSQGSGRTEPVTVQENWPAFQGALVVCTGGGDPEVKLGILESVSALTGLRSNEIAIKERK
ncbi:MAG: stage III sporulation protein AG [Oscillospiraceae bacterium]|nr:stage III sporulation protein AG [Oscillospiraceae bacterium]